MFQNKIFRVDVLDEIHVLLARLLPLLVRHLPGAVSKGLQPHASHLLMFGYILFRLVSITI